MKILTVYFKSFLLVLILSINFNYAHEKSLSAAPSNIEYYGMHMFTEFIVALVAGTMIHDWNDNIIIRMIEIAGGLTLLYKIPELTDTYLLNAPFKRTQTQKIVTFLCRRLPWNPFGALVGEFLVKNIDETKIFKYSN